MRGHELSIIEKKALGALLILSDKDMLVTGNLMRMKTIALAMGYKKPGGAISFALKSLEMKSFITIEKESIQVHL